jgi:AraC-like DNA-binding protein
MSHSYAQSPLDPQIVEAVIAGLSLLQPVSPAFRQDIYKHTFQVQVKKNTFLLKEGMVCDHMYFIYQGIVRGFSTKRHKELTTWISMEGDFVSSISGLYGKISRESMQAMDECTLIGVSITVMQQWYEMYPEMNIIMRKILESYYQDAEERSYIIRIGTANEKYDYFVESRPGQIDRVPLSCIASFLGMTTATLERIRDKKKAEKGGSDLQRIQLLEKSIEEKGLFKIKSLSVSQLAAMLSIPAYSLSALLNTHYRKKFSDFINGYRVAFVKQQLAEGKDWKQNKVGALGLEAGFASRSTFFAAFRKQEGVTPVAYAAQLE